MNHRNPFNTCRALLFTCLLVVTLAACTPGGTVPPTSIPSVMAKPTLAATATPISIPTIKPPLTTTFTSIPPTSPAPTVLMTYPGRLNCTIKVNTQTWKIDDYWRKNIIGQTINTPNPAVLVSNNNGGGIPFLVGHQIYPDCYVKWGPEAVWPRMNIKESFENLGGKEWKISDVENEVVRGNNAIRVYLLPELDIRFLQGSSTDESQKQACTKDVYQILESVSCGQAPHKSGSGIGKIAFISEREMYYNPISIMNADGSHLVRSPNTLVQVDDLRWSPKGNKIAFVAKLGDAKKYLRGEIYIINADGSNPINLTNNKAEDISPTWSPDGKQIAFVSNRDGNNEVYSMNADGSNLTNLTQNSAEDSSPAWSPDGRKIAFMSERDGKSDIYVMETDGSNPTRLTPDIWNIFGHLAWSPDGSKLAFVSAGEAYYYLSVMNIDGSNPVNLTPKGFRYFFSWSPDGNRIVFDGRDGEIYVINADGSNPVNLTQNPAHDISPAWSPDGSQIVFQSDRDGNNEIYSMNADGSNLTRLINNPGSDISPVWGP